jgi:DNA-binding MarR family transcriptional regulator
MTEAGALADELGMLIGQLHRAAGAEEVSLTATQRIVLAELFSSGPLRVGALAERAGVSDPTVSRAVDGLVTLGLASRSVDPDDRRAVIVAATARGRDRMRRRRQAMTLALASALEGMAPEDADLLLALISRLVVELHTSQTRDPRHGALLAP